MMRFFNIWRLTYMRPPQGAWEGLGSFALMREFKALDGEGSRLRGANGLLAPIATLERRLLRPSSIDVAATKRLKELSLRYHGVISQMLGSQSVPVAEARDRKREVFLTAANLFRSESDPRRYPVALWEAYIQVMGSAPPSLKPKLMLRAFVDEIQSGEERGVLKWIGYDGVSSSGGYTQELRRVEQRGLELLHEQVTAMDTAMDQITDHALKFSEVSRWDGPAAVPKYEAWLVA
jgi:hypothetical protein